MQNSSTSLLCLFAGIFLLACVYSSSLKAHDSGINNGKADHRHVYKANAYGKGATVGHYAKPAGSQGIVIWQASPKQGYGKTRPGFKMPKRHHRQPTQKQMYQQKPVFTKEQSRIPDLARK